MESEVGDTQNGKTIFKMKGMEKMMFAKYDGVNYPHPFESGNVKEKVKQMKEMARDFTIRDDDTIIVGHPRCGNHWTYEVVNMILRQEATYTPISYVNNLIDYCTSGEEKSLADLQSPRILCQHSYLRDLPTQAIQKRTKVICLVREPRSALLSLYTLNVEMKGDNLRFAGTWDDFFEAVMAREFNWGNIIDHYKDMEDFRKKHPEIPIYIRSFEKGLNDPVQQIREMCAFLGKPDHLASDIAKLTAFNAMKTGTQEKFKKSEERFFEKGRKGYLAGAKAGVWRNWFTAAQNERFSRDLDEKLRGTSIASLIEA